MDEESKALDSRLIMDEHDLGIISAYQPDKTKIQNEKALGLLLAYSHKMGLYVVKVRVSLLKDTTQKSSSSYVSYLLLADFTSNRNIGLSTLLAKAAKKFNQNVFFLKEPSKVPQLMSLSNQDGYQPESIEMNGLWLPNIPNLESAISLISECDVQLKSAEAVLQPDHIMGLWPLYLNLSRKWKDYNDFI
ncbi:hypothetical protein [Hellea balneolensis]|uniref:hypothetical protein n=1 Tax=Hellea balneolensis TaxID=287478 RepID=UPI0012B6D19D|nr:hypothetical protein [Hellea balneolensis]